MRGIRRHGLGWQAEVRVTGQPRAIRQFPLATPPAEMQRWRRAEQGRLRSLRPQHGAGSFAADARNYLAARRAMPGIAERKRHIDLWVAIFGERPRSSVQAWEIRVVRDQWLLEGPRREWRAWRTDGDDRPGGRWVDVPGPLSASQVNKRLRALQNLYTVLDGRHAPNPAREVPEATEPDPEARGLPYDVIEAILSQMPDRGRPADGTRAPHSLTKARLRCIAYTGLSHAQLANIDLVRDVDAAAGAIRTPRRAKGRGRAAEWRPVPAEGIAALETLRALGGGGRFSRSAMWKSFQRAAAKLDLHGLRPYDLRHSYATETLAKLGDVKLTQMLMGHSSGQTTLRYTMGAVPRMLSEAIVRVRAAGGFRGAIRGAIETREDESFREKSREAEPAAQRRRPAKSREKPRK